MNKFKDFMKDVEERLNKTNVLGPYPIMHTIAEVAKEAIENDRLDIYDLWGIKNVYDFGRNFEKELLPRIVGRLLICDPTETISPEAMDELTKTEVVREFTYDGHHYTNLNINIAPYGINFYSDTNVPHAQDVLREICCRVVMAIFCDLYSRAVLNKSMLFQERLLYTAIQTNIEHPNTTVVQSNVWEGIQASRHNDIAFNLGRMRPEGDRLNVTYKYFTKFIGEGLH